MIGHSKSIHTPRKIYLAHAFMVGLSAVLALSCRTPSNGSEEKAIQSASLENGLYTVACQQGTCENGRSIIYNVDTRTLFENGKSLCDEACGSPTPGNGNNSSGSLTEFCSRLSSVQIPPELNRYTYAFQGVTDRDVCFQFPNAFSLLLAVPEFASLLTRETLINIQKANQLPSYDKTTKILTVWSGLSIENFSEQSRSIFTTLGIPLDKLLPLENSLNYEQNFDKLADLKNEKDFNCIDCDTNQNRNNPTSIVSGKVLVADPVTFAFPSVPRMLSLACVDAGLITTQDKLPILKFMIAPDDLKPIRPTFVLTVSRLRTGSLMFVISHRDQIVTSRELASPLALNFPDRNLNFTTPLANRLCLKADESSVVVTVGRDKIINTAEMTPNPLTQNQLKGRFFLGTNFDRSVVPDKMIALDNFVYRGR